MWKNAEKNNSKYGHFLRKDKHRPLKYKANYRRASPEWKTRMNRIIYVGGTFKEMKKEHNKEVYKNFVGLNFYRS